MSKPECRIEFQVTGRREGEDDFTEIGFGASSARDDPNTCTHEIASVVVNGLWETETGQSDPSGVMGR